jgi:hypothetical protein
VCRRKRDQFGLPEFRTATRLIHSWLRACCRSLSRSWSSLPIADARQDDFTWRVPDVRPRSDQLMSTASLNAHNPVARCLRRTQGNHPVARFREQRGLHGYLKSRHEDGVVVNPLGGEVDVHSVQFMFLNGI